MIILYLPPTVLTPGSTSLPFPGSRPEALLITHTNPAWTDLITLSPYRSRYAQVLGFFPLRWPDVLTSGFYLSSCVSTPSAQTASGL